MKRFPLLILLLLLCCMSVYAQSYLPMPSFHGLEDGGQIYQLRPGYYNNFADYYFQEHTEYSGIIVSSATSGDPMDATGAGLPHFWDDVNQKLVPLLRNLKAGANITITTSDTGTTISSTGGIASVTAEEEGAIVGQYNTFNFVGIGATAVDNATQVNINIPGTNVQSASSELGDATGFNFVIENGDVTITDNIATVTILDATGKVPPIIIAAYNSSATEQAVADYICSGSNDEVEFNAAVTLAGTFSGGSEIYVCSGDYYIASSITIATSYVRLRGNLPRLHQAYNSASSEDGLIRLVNDVNFVELVGLELNGRKSSWTGRGITWTGIATARSPDNILIRDCYVHDFSSDGMYGTYVGAEYWTITDSRFVSNGGHGLNIEISESTIHNVISRDNSGSGFYMINGSADNRFSDCLAQNNSGMGFYFETNGSDTLVSNCKAISNGAEGFRSYQGEIYFSMCHASGGTVGFYSHTARFTIDSCVIDSPSSTGIYLRESHQSVLSNNYINAPGGYGIELFSTNSSLIQGNLVNNPSSTGIRLDDICHETSVKGNHILSAGGSGILIYNSDYCDVSDNYIEQDASHGVSLVWEVIGTVVKGNTFKTITAGTLYAIAMSDQVAVSYPQDTVLSGNTMIGDYADFVSNSDPSVIYYAESGTHRVDSAGDPYVSVTAGTAGTVFNASGSIVPVANLENGQWNPYFNSSNEPEISYKDPSGTTGTVSFLGSISASSGDTIYHDGSTWNATPEITLWDQLSDVDTHSTKQIGYVPYWTGTVWSATPQAAGGAGGGGASVLNDLTDVTVSSVADNQHLIYNSGTGQWVNTDPSHYINPIDRPKSSADTPDDEFDGPTLAAKWNVVSGATGTINLLGAPGDVIDLLTRPGWMLAQSNGAGSFNIQLRQDYTLIDGDTIILAYDMNGFMDGTNNLVDTSIQFGLNDTDTGIASGNMARIFAYTTTSETFALQSSDGSTAIVHITDINAQKMYFRITRNGFTYNCFVSFTGDSWIPIRSINHGIALDNVWIAVYNADDGSPGWDPVYAFDWLRINSTGKGHDVYPFTH